MSAFFAVTNSTRWVEFLFTHEVEPFFKSGNGQSLAGRWNALISTGTKHGGFEYNYEGQRTAGVDIILSKVSGMPSILTMSWSDLNVLEEIHNRHEAKSKSTTTN